MDHAAWTSSVEFIHTLPGFNDPDSDDPWPIPMSLEENLSDLERHDRDFREWKGFTYTVLDPTSLVTLLAVSTSTPLLTRTTTPRSNLGCEFRTPN